MKRSNSVSCRLNSTLDPSRSNIEFLEPRIAPASVSVTYTDYDGDLVKVTASKPGNVPPLDINDFVFTDGNQDGQLAALILTEPGFDGASIVFKIMKRNLGDGLVHVGRIDATGIDLNKVIVKGDLGKIVAGDVTTSNDPGLNLLRVRSMGTLGLFTQGGEGDLDSLITGRLGALNVTKDFVDGSLGTTATAASDASIGSIFIGGSVVGGTDGYTGNIFGAGGIERVHIIGDIVGGARDASGSVSSAGSIKSVRVGGNLIGGSGGYSGSISSSASMGDVRIGGSVTGGVGHYSGLIYGNRAIGDVIIGGDFIGGSMTGDTTLDHSGEIYSGGSIASVTIRGSFISGSKSGTATLTNCGAIVADDDLGPVRIGGSIVGNDYNRAFIIAKGQAEKPSSGYDTAIASISVGGDVRFARILAGFDFQHSPVNADASIGAVYVGCSWVASDLVAGATAGPDGFFGTRDDTLQPDGGPALIARIASMTIKGGALGSLRVGDNFGVVAEEIGRLTLGQRSASADLTKIINFPFTDDLWLVELHRTDPL